VPPFHPEIGALGEGASRGVRVQPGTLLGLYGRSWRVLSVIAVDGIIPLD
jgi:hypothetical protein